ncbi:MAG TPA: UPF0182 family protein [Armatimonadota bacterium]|nr:UPF0182 family protein [Armatimonadota bacterium]HOM81012.1 UPF0182 family protein [Armatimonadota bacterium]HPO72663.1 UPF0182 family protein [Armatimonadota bacterium]HPT98569.1 UPF0182 family protein [Armatimonadota bacterium]
MALVLGAVFFGSELIRLYTDWLWFLDVGYRDVFVKTTVIKVGLMVAAALLFFALIYANLLVAERLTPRPALYLDDQRQFRLTLTPFGRQGLSIILLIVAAAISLTVGLAAAKGWYDYLFFRNPVPFNQADPIFHRDVGFYVFQLPFVRFVYRWLMVGLGLSLFAVAGLYWFDKGLDFVNGYVRIATHARVHLSALLAAILLTKAWGYWLARYELLFTPHRLFFGAGFVDVHIRLVVLNVLVVLAVVAGLVMLANIRLRGVRLPMIIVGAWIAVSFVGGIVLPSVVQKVRVTPNELSAEEKFISNSIEATRNAFGLSKIQRRSFPAAGALKMADIRDNHETMRSIRLWDYEPLLDAYRQIQTIRAYYTFRGADVDRYQFPDGVRQVAISVRELDVKRLGGAESSWINRHLIYTHGYGLCMSPVDRVAEGGLPELIIKDFPPQAPEALQLTRPQVYFGELTNDYAIVNTTEEEFDYPSGDENMTTRYESDRGVRIAGLFRRLMFALRFGDQNILLSTHLNADSRILYSRNIQERARRIAPFLRLDSDPYPVIHQGRIVWIIDAYTTSPWYPYSQRIQPDPPRWDTVLNYMRNSVKITVDAYDGTVTLYVADESDPIITSLQKAFPGLFRPLSEMPEALHAHLRYPKDLFNFQASIYAGYHMTDPRVFYNREDMWQVPRLQRDTTDDLGLPIKSPPMAPYYMVMRLPDGDGAEYILMLPFTPTGDKQNMISWMAARCDPEHLGELVVYNFPKQKLVYGPAQIDALIDQHPRISEKLTLWSQSGSEVIRAPVMVIPIEDSILYVEPLYLRARNSRIPELKQVIVAYGSQVEMTDTLEESLRRIFGGDSTHSVAAAASTPPASRPTPAASPAPAGRPVDTPSPGISEEMRRLIDAASAQFERAQDAMRKGDWTTYGNEMKQLQQSLERLRQVSSQ